MTRNLGILLFSIVVACSRNAPEQEAAPASSASLHVKSVASATAGAKAVASAEAPVPSGRSSGSSSTRSPAAPLASAAPGIGATCEKVCAYSGQLNCGKTDHCVQDCVEMASITPCTAAFRSLYSCLLREPLSHWECSEDHMGAIRDGYCESEQAAAATCVEKLTNTEPGRP